MNNQPLRPEMPKWLEDQQHNSWQIEILVAGGFIFFFAQLPVHFKNFFFTGIDLQGGSEITSLIPILTTGGYMFSRAIQIGFAVNLILRAIWVGFLGINFAYPKGIDFEGLNYAAFLQEKLRKRPSSVQRILFLEKISSLSYSIAILITLMSVGIFFALLVIFFFIEQFLPTSYNHPALGFFLLFLLFLFKLGIFDELFLNRLQKWPWIPRIYYPFHRLFNALTLTDFYYQEWVTLLSNSKKIIIYLIIFFYFAVSFLISITEMSSFASFGFSFPKLALNDQRFFTKYKNTYFSNLPEDCYDEYLDEQSWIWRFSINGPVVDGEVLSIFVTYRKELDDVLTYFIRQHGGIVGIDSLKHSGGLRMRNKEKINAALDELFIVVIDSVEYNHLNWHFGLHPKTKQAGFTTFINLEKLAKGNHQLSFDYQYLRSDHSTGRTYLYPIPFAKE